MRFIQIIVHDWHESGSYANIEREISEEKKKRFFKTCFFTSVRSLSSILHTRVLCNLWGFIARRSAPPRRVYIIIIRCTIFIRVIIRSPTTIKTLKNITPNDYGGGFRIVRGIDVKYSHSNFHTRTWLVAATDTTA